MFKPKAFQYATDLYAAERRTLNSETETATEAYNIDKNIDINKKTTYQSFTDHANLEINERFKQTIEITNQPNDFVLNLQISKISTPVSMQSVCVFCFCFF